MNESAFPWQIDNGETMRGHTGMTLRDYFAAKAMQAMITHPDSRDDVDAGVYAKGSYVMADAMMKAREA
jgi:hypothetical protein